VSGAAGISATYLQKLERAQVGEPSPRILRSLATALSIDYSRLMELAGYDLTLDRRVAPDVVGARLASSSLTETEERAVLAFIHHLIEERQGPKAPLRKAAEKGRTSFSKNK
jgi:transcriptional regulator with XRE-family HTH domain